MEMVNITGGMVHYLRTFLQGQHQILLAALDKDRGLVLVMHHYVQIWHLHRMVKAAH